MRLTLVRAKVYKPNPKYGHWMSWFLCECGNGVLTRHEQGLSGQVISCGCAKSKAIQKRLTETEWPTKHGHARKGRPSPTYKSWRAMIQRCEVPTATKYDQYGGRGIRVCERWKHSFDAFLEDMGERPEDTSIDRIDSTGNYEPGNCRWATITEQNSNRKGVERFEWEGKTYTIPEICKAYGLNSNTFRSRLWRGWSVEKIMTTPFKEKKK